MNCESIWNQLIHVINLFALKCFDLVDYKNIPIIYQVHKNQLPDCIQRLFDTKESQYELRGLGRFEKPRAWTNIKSRCMSVKEANLWNGCDEEVKCVVQFAY